jgi:hypothetical protein
VQNLRTAANFPVLRFPSLTQCRFGQICQKLRGLSARCGRAVRCSVARLPPMRSDSYDKLLDTASKPGKSGLLITRAELRCATETLSFSPKRPLPNSLLIVVLAEVTLRRPKHTITIKPRTYHAQTAHLINVCILRSATNLSLSIHFPLLIQCEDEKARKHVYVRDKIPTFSSSASAHLLFQPYKQPNITSNSGTGLDFNICAEYSTCNRKDVLSPYSPSPPFLISPSSSSIYFPES